jgi:hypothetical protein
MNRPPAVASSELLAALALAVGTLCLGVFLSFQFGTEAPGANTGTFLMRLCVVIAVLTVAKYTFAIGRQRGFPVRREDGSLHGENLLRNLVATFLAFFCVGLLATPFLGVVFNLAR